MTKPLTVADIPNDLAECQQMLESLVAKLAEKDGRIEALMHQMQQLLRAKFGRKAETIDFGQLRLFEKTADEVDLAEGEPEQKSAGPKPAHGRSKPSKELPRKQIRYELNGAERNCPECGEERINIGEEVTEQYDYVPSSVCVIEHVRCKYACRACTGNVSIAAGAKKPIERGSAAAGMLAYVATSKFADHLPLNRLESIFHRQGATIARSTMCDWVAATANLLEPLYERMKAKILQSRVIWTDDTPVKLQDRQHEKNMREARIWVYLGDAKNQFTIFDFTDSRKRDGPKTFLSGFRGYLQADAFTGYDCIYAEGLVMEVACMAHARRKFFESQTSDKIYADQALNFIQELYRIEKDGKSLSREGRQRLRLEKSTRILRTFKVWLDQTRLSSLPKSPLGKAITYALNNWKALCRFVIDGELTIDNNPSERAIRTIAIGRKNWLFAGSREGGRNAAIISSFIASCKQRDLNPHEYLRDVLTRLNGVSEDNLDELLPGTWVPMLR